MHFKTTLITELGPFIYGKTCWLEYQSQLDTLFEEHDVPEERKKDLCVSLIGKKGLKILKKKLAPQTVQDVDYNTIVVKLESHFYPKLTQADHLVKFTHRPQRKHESFFDYIVALRKLLINCQCNAEEQLKKQIMVGIRHEDLRQQFSEINDVTLTKLFEMGLAYDYAKKIKAAPPPRNHKARINREKICFRCNGSIPRQHKNISCPFEWAVCKHCHVKGHVSVACKYKELLCSYCNVKGHIARICEKIG